jgi:hypothetical protein
VSAGDEHSRERHDGSAVDVVVHHRFVEGFYQPGLYLEALRRRDVFEMDAAERRRDAHDGLDELAWVFRVNQDRHRGDVGELVVEDGLTFHHGHRGDRSYVAQSEDARAVRADGDAASDHSQLAGERGVLGNRHARPRHPRGVDVAHVLNRPHWPGRLDGKFPTLVAQQRPVPRPQDLDAGKCVQHLCDILGVVPVADFECDLTHRGGPSDAYGGHVADQPFPIGYRTGHPGE